MRTLPELLAGCPRPDSHQEKKMPWQSVRAFPGFMLYRLYILLTRPHKAIAEFGAGDYKTSFCFFLFFTIIFSFLIDLEPMLRSIIFSMMNVPGESLANGISSIPSMIPLILASALERSIYDCLNFGIAAGILILLLQGVSGKSDWRTAFSISAYCNPVYSIPGLIISYATLSLGYLHPSEIRGIVGAIAIAGEVIGISLVLVIAGYGIASVVKTPVPLAIIIALSWIILGMLVSYLVQNFIVFPLEYDVSQWTSATFFPRSYPAAGSG